MRLTSLLLTITQVILAARVIRRMVATTGGRKIERAEPDPGSPETVSVLLPVLDEQSRLAPCLEGLIAQGPEVREILVIDGGSQDGTVALAQSYAQRDPRVRIIPAPGTTSGLNPKALQLEAGLNEASSESQWILTIDADVRPKPELIRSLLAEAQKQGIPALSVATEQRLSGSGEGLIHPSLLTTLVYRFGIPGTVTADPALVQANGQCFLARRSVLTQVGGFRSVADSICEDVTLARSIAALGHPVGFFETDGLVSVEMYGGFGDAWSNWTRSLPMRDRYFRGAGFVGLAEVLLVQGLPFWRWLFNRKGIANRVNRVLLVMRLGVLAGTARAYPERPATYWLSPLLDLPVSLKLIQMALRRSHVWRGRVVTPGAHS